MPKSKIPPFKTNLSEHVHTLMDSKGRKIPNIGLLYTPGAYNTIVHNSYKNKQNDEDFCILFNTLIHHHIDSVTEKLVVDEGYTKNETRVISKNIRHTPDIAEFFDDYIQLARDGKKMMSRTFFDNPKNTQHSGFLTFTFNGGIEGEVKQKIEENGLQYLYVVNAVAQGGGNGQSVVKAFSQTEFVFLEEDVNRYIQFIKDVAAYHQFMVDYNKEETSGKSLLKSSFETWALTTGKIGIKEMIIPSGSDITTKVNKKSKNIAQVEKGKKRKSGVDYIDLRVQKGKKKKDILEYMKHNVVDDEDDDGQDEEDESTTNEDSD